MTQGMTEPDLLTWADSHAHRGDPGTSVIAALHATQFFGGHCAKIYAALLECPDGLTFHEIANLTGLDYHAVARRVSDLCKADPPKAEDSGERRRNDSGRLASVWRAR